MDQISPIVKSIGVFIEKRGFLVGLLLTLSLLWPLFISPYFTHHDNVQVIRLYEMDKCVKDLQIPCRWVPDLGGLYGYPIFNYYAPLPYYFGEVVYLLTHSLTLSVKIMFIFSFVGSYVFMFLLGRKLWGQMGGSLSAIFYSLAPYHAVLFYVRGAMGEMWGLLAIPALFWSVLRLKDSLSMSNVLLVGLFTAVLITSHNLSVMLFLPFTLLFIGAIFLFSRGWKEGTDRIKFLKFISFSILLGLLISAFYWIPMLAEKNFVHVETTTFGYFSYTEHFKGLRKLLLDTSWGWGASVREVPGGERDGMSFQIGWAHLLGWILTLSAAFIARRANKVNIFLLTFFSLASLIGIFMIHPSSKFVWDLIVPLKYFQFPWRFLGLVIFFVPLLVGSIMVAAPDKMKKYLWVSLVVLVFVFNFSYFRPEKFINTTDQELLSGRNWDSQIKRSIFDFLPSFATEPPAELATSRYKILTGDMKVGNYQEGTNWISFEANVKSHSIIRLSQYYFPNWKIFVNGEEIKVDYENNLGLMTFILGEGSYDVYARLQDTPIRTISNLLTVFGFFLMLSLFLTRSSKIRGYMVYCLKGFIGK